jgi:protein TonB
VLVLLAEKERKYRIEVGSGLESVLPDTLVASLGAEMVPMLQQNDYGGALLHVTKRISEVLEATLVGPPDLKIPSPNMDHYGDPLAKLLNGSGGPGGGIRSGTGTGIGSAEGGDTGGGAYHPGTGGVGYPTCVYCPDPKYTEEARKAKYQGAVVLQVVITPDGRATDIQVVKSPGLGLEEKSVEAVKQWQFKPANGPGGKPVPVVVPLEITFRLLN